MATYGTSNKYINYSVNSQELSYDINSNSSILRVWVDGWRTNTGYTTSGSGTVYARINGVVYSAGITSSQKITSTPIRLGTWDVTISHDADGSKAINVTGWISHSQFSSSEQGYTHTLTTIPRVSGVRCDGGTFGSALTIYFDRKSDNFTHHLYYSLNGGPETGIGADYSTSATWTPPLSLLNSVTGADSTTIMFRAYTFNGGTNIGSSTCTCTVKIPTNIVPTFTSITATPVNPFGSLYLQGKSSIKLTINGASGVYGSTIKTYSISGGDYSYSGDKNTYTTGVVDKSGDITFTATITDSRGRTASKTVKVTVTAYTLPTLTFETYRCDSSGTKDIIKGTYIYVKPTFTYCVITGNAIKTKSIKINNTSKSTAFNSGQGYVFSGYALNTTHEVEVSITDNVGNTVTVIHDIDIGKVILNIPPHKNGVGWGRYCDKEGEFQIEYDLNIFGKILKNGEELPVFTKNGNYSVPPAPIEKKDIYFKYSTEEQFTGEYWIDGKKIYQKSYNLGTINAFKKIENIANFDRNIRYEFSMRANDKISGVNGIANTDLFVTTGGDVYINTNGNTRYDVVLTLWYTKN
ncbi:DUF859 family phage minor structural protein [Thomasclavelia ramosa]|uniref:DUF859 family phage minor structural protein n=1 Tax=Thomasclavelia ramosa TaxID=1547 RepID=UPI000E549424|nr:DUF859 family phage minor structural protein [Thomasclavelia ramosa]RGT19406.1 hypothetical protein DWX42_17460 [Thomasclavelia ramosa]